MAICSLKSGISTIQEDVFARWLWTIMNVLQKCQWNFFAFNDKRLCHCCSISSDKTKATQSEWVPLYTGYVLLCRFPQILCVLDNVFPLIGFAWLHTLQMLRSWFQSSSFCSTLHFGFRWATPNPRLYVLSIISQSSTAWRICTLR